MIMYFSKTSINIDFGSNLHEHVFNWTFLLGYYDQLAKIRVSTWRLSDLTSYLSDIPVFDGLSQYEEEFDCPGIRVAKKVSKNSFVLRQ